jgi:hypothetical protein
LDHHIVHRGDADVEITSSAQIVNLTGSIGRISKVSPGLSKHYSGMAIVRVVRLSGEQHLQFLLLGAIQR